MQTIRSLPWLRPTQRSSSTRQVTASSASGAARDAVDPLVALCNGARRRVAAGAGDRYRGAYWVTTMAVWPYNDPTLAALTPDEAAD